MIALDSAAIKGNTLDDSPFHTLITPYTPNDVTAITVKDDLHFNIQQELVF